MPRLSLYRPEKGQDYRFIDKTIWEMFQIGGTDVLVHKYTGPGSSGENTPSTPVYNSTSETQIQDLLFLENRDRKYDPDVYILRGVYNMQDLDFNLSQFGLFLQNDTVFVTFHINDTVEKIGRKIISGDVIELPHLKDDHALNDLKFALKRFYVIEEVTRAAEGFSVTWYPHLYRAKCKPLVDSQEFKEILDGIANRESDRGTYNPAITYYPGDIIRSPDDKQYEVLREVTGVAPPNSTYFKPADTLRDIVSTYEKEMQITQAILNQAESDAPYSGYDTKRFYTLQVGDDGKPELLTSDSETLAASNTTLDVSLIIKNAEKEGYDGYLLGTSEAPNGAPFTSGIAFPVVAQEGQYHLRTDYKPNRLFRFNSRYWVKVDDIVRTTMSNLGPSDVAPGERFEGYDVRNNQKSTFINNTTVNTVNGKPINEKQSLSKALKPQADN
jgi:hypothetical protein